MTRAILRLGPKEKAKLATGPDRDPRRKSNRKLLALLFFSIYDFHGKQNLQTSVCGVWSPVTTENILRCHNPFKFLSQSEVCEQFIYSVYTKDTSDKKGQARDTSVNVTL